MFLIVAQCIPSYGILLATVQDHNCYENTATVLMVTNLPTVRSTPHHGVSHLSTVFYKLLDAMVLSSPWYGVLFTMVGSTRYHGTEYYSIMLCYVIRDEDLKPGPVTSITSILSLEQLL